MTLAELGVVSRLRRSRQAVRMTGLDVGVSRSGRRSRVGKLVKQGAPQLLWALYEAARWACREQSPTTATTGACAGAASRTRAPR